MLTVNKTDKASYRSFYKVQNVKTKLTARYPFLPSNQIGSDSFFFSFFLSPRDQSFLGVGPPPSLGPIHLGRGGGGGGGVWWEGNPVGPPLCQHHPWGLYGHGDSQVSRPGHVCMGPCACTVQ